MANIDVINYSVLRCGGVPMGRACAELGVNSGRGSELEASFRRSPPESHPRFARHAKHLRAVRRCGGFPVLAR